MLHRVLHLVQVAELLLEEAGSVTLRAFLPQEGLVVGIELLGVGNGDVQQHSLVWIEQLVEGLDAERPSMLGSVLQLVEVPQKWVHQVGLICELLRRWLDAWLATRCRGRTWSMIGTAVVGVHLVLSKPILLLTAWCISLICLFCLWLMHVYLKPLI